MADDETLRLGADVASAVAAFDKLEAEAKQTGEALSSSFVKADASAAKFLAQVETGSKGAERSMALLAVQINAVEQEIAQLKAQGKPTALMEAGLDSLKAKLALGTAQLGQFRAAAADAADATRKATQRAGEFSGSVTDVTGTLKTLSPTLGNAIDKYSILAAKAFVAVKAMQVSAEALKEVAKATGEYNGATRDAIDSASGFASSIASFDFAGAIAKAGQFLGAMHDLTQGISETTAALGNLADAQDARNFAGLLKTQQDLVKGHEEEVDALNRKAAAISREITTQQQAGEVQGYVRDAIKETLDSYDKLHEAVPSQLAEQAASLGIVSSAQEKATESAAKLEAAGVGGSERRAAAEESASARIIATLAAQEAAMTRLLEETAKYVAERDKILNAPNKGFDGSTDKAAATEKLAGLNDQIKAIQDSTLVSPEQMEQLSELRRRAADAAREVSDLGQVYTLANMNGEELAIKQNAAWEKYYAIRHANDALVQRNVDADLAALAEQTDAVGELSDAASDAAGSFGEVADAAGDVGKQAKRGAKEGKDALSELTEGAGEALPLLKELRDVMQAIVELGAQADI